MALATILLAATGCFRSSLDTSCTREGGATGCFIGEFCNTQGVCELCVGGACGGLEELDMSPLQEEMSARCGACPGPCRPDGSCIELDYLTAGVRFACVASAEEGRAWCWGGNSTSQLGVNSEQSAFEPVEATLNPEIRGAGIASMRAGGRHTCLTTRDTELDDSTWCWGANDDDQLGSIDSPHPSTLPVRVELSFEVGAQADSSRARLSAGANHSCVQRLDASPGTVATQCWGRNDVGQLARSASLSCPNPATSCLLPQDTRFARNAGASLRAVSAGGDSTCSVESAPGSEELYLLCAGELGVPSSDGTSQLSYYPERVAPFPARGSAAGQTPCRLEVGANGGCVIASEGSCAARPVGQVSCFGRGNRAPLGRFDESDRTEALPVLDERGDPLREIMDLAVGDVHACATDGRAVWCWGESEGARLGATVAGRPATAVVVEFKEPTGAIKRVAVGDTFSCALAERGVWCWGKGESGQLGRGQVEGLKTGLSAGRVTF